MRKRLVGSIVCIGVLMGPLQLSSVAAVAGQGGTTLAASVRSAPKLAGEPTTIRGAARAGQTVELQRRRDGRWVRVAERTAGRDGTVVFKVRVARVAALYRLVARPVGRAHASVQSVPSRTIRVAPAAPRASLELENAPIGQDHGKAATPGLASFWPARPGAPVVVQRRQGAKWTDVVSGQQGSDGRFSFQVPATRGTAFRAVSRPARALRAVVSPTRTAQVWRASFDDEFNSAALNPVWAERSSLGTGRACVTTSDGYRLREGTLQLFAVPDATAAAADETCPHGRYRNGHLGTQQSVAFRYGYAAARIKFSPEHGQHGAFWLQPKPGTATLAPEKNGAEIDVAEYFGDSGTGGALGQWVHYFETKPDGIVARAKTGGLRTNLRAIVGPTAQVSDGYHVVSLEWTPQEYVFRVDGVITFRTTQGVSQQPQYLILSMLSSDWELPQLGANLPSPMSVDWVRVWQG